jgi:hypothetical protein
MCDKDWSNFKNAKAYYKSCGFDTKAIYDIKDFKTRIGKIKKELYENKIYLLNVGWSGVGPEAQNIIEEAYNIIDSTTEFKGVDKFKSFKLLYSEDFLYHLTKSGEIPFILDYSAFKSATEKKQVQQTIKMMMEVMTKYFPKNNLKLDKNTLKLSIKNLDKQKSAK